MPLTTGITEKALRKMPHLIAGATAKRGAGADPGRASRARAAENTVGQYMRRRGSHFFLPSRASPFVTELKAHTQVPLTGMQTYLPRLTPETASRTNTTASRAAHTGAKVAENGAQARAAGQDQAEEAPNPL